jgi:hypothetical protein
MRDDCGSVNVVPSRVGAFRRAVHFQIVEGATPKSYEMVHRLRTESKMHPCNMIEVYSQNMNVHHDKSIHDEALPVLRF